LERTAISLIKVMHTVTKTLEERFKVKCSKPNMTILCPDNNLCHSLRLGTKIIFQYRKYLSLNFNKLFIFNPNLLSLAKKLLTFYHDSVLKIYEPNPLISKIIIYGMDNNMMKWKKEGVLANLYLMKIHLLIIKRFIAKGISSWIMKFFH
jgi:hypothetical protein